MNQKTFQSGFDKFVNGCLDLFPVITVIAEHQSVDGKAAIHLKIKTDSACSKVRRLCDISQVT